MMHTIHALQSFGYDVRLYVIYKKTQKPLKELAEGVKFQGVSIEDAIDIARDENARSFIGAANVDTAKDQVMEMLPHCSAVVIHGAGWIDGEVLESAVQNNVRIGVVRKSLSSLLRKEYGVNSMYLPQIYNMYEGEAVIRDIHAVSISQISWSKNSHMIIEANKRLPEEIQVRMYGNYSRKFDHFKLKNIQENWKELWWEGKFDSANGGAVKIASRAKFVIDLSIIKNDGGGTQYTFLEAFNGMSHLILHESWLDFPGEVDERCVIPVSNVDDLVRVLTDDGMYPTKLLRGWDIMEAHSPERTLPYYKKFIGL